MKMPKVFIEYRPRLGAAHVYISTESSQIGFPKSFCSIEQSTNSISLVERSENGTENETAKFLWPDKFGKLCSNEAGKEDYWIYLFYFSFRLIKITISVHVFPYYDVNFREVKRGPRLMIKKIVQYILNLQQKFWKICIDSLTN